MSALRWWAERVGRPGVVGTNAAHGIGERRYVTNEDRSAVLDPEKLARVTDAHVRMSLELQAAFGLRREEAIKFTPAYADRGDRVRIKASWAKGGRAREIPIWNEGQRAVLDAARRLAGGGALIPGGRNYAAHRKVYERQTEAAGLVAHARAAPRVRPGPLRGPDGLEGAGGGRPPAAVARACEAAHRQGGAHDDRARARPWPPPKSHEPANT